MRRFAPRATIELHDTYFDSADWRIFNAGFALRLRRSREPTGAERTELTLKSLAPARGGFADRLELTECVPDDEGLARVLDSPTGIGERIRSLVGDRKLEPLFHSKTRRERQQLLEADSDLPLAEVDLDHTSLETTGGASRQLTRVEVECLNADPAVVEPLIEQLREAARLEPANESKFRAGLSVAGLEPMSAWQPPHRPLAPSMPFDLAVVAVLAKYFAATISWEPQARMGDPHAVHQMRVAARHLDVLLKTFAKYAPRWAVRFRRTVRALVKALGVVRDCDVQIAWLDARQTAPPKPDDVIGPLRSRLDAARTAGRGELLAFLDSADARDWVDTWREAIDQGHRGTVAAQRASTASVARDLITRRARKLRKRIDRLGDSATPGDYHEVRIRAKRLRYTLDAFADLYGEPAAEYGRALARLQTVLGDYHDAAVRAERFARLATAELPAAVSFGIGRLVERDQQALETCRARLPKAWRKLRRRRWRELRTALRRADESVQ